MANFIASSLAGMLGLNLGNLSEYPVIGNKYYVILGTFITSFSKVSGIVLKSSQLTAINEGGSNKPYIMRDIKKDFNTMTFEKGYGTLDVMDMINKITVLTVLIKGNSGEITGVYYTDRAVVQKIELSQLEANTSQPLIQSMTIAYNSLKKSSKAMAALKSMNSMGISTSFAEQAFSSQARQKAKNEEERRNAEKKLQEEKRLQQAKNNKTPSETVKKTDAQIKAETEAKIKEANKKVKNTEQKGSKPTLNPFVNAAASQNLTAAEIEKNRRDKVEEADMNNISDKIEF